MPCITAKDLVDIVTVFRPRGGLGFPSHVTPSEPIMKLLSATVVYSCESRGRVAQIITATVCEDNSDLVKLEMDGENLVVSKPQWAAMKKVMEGMFEE